MNPGREHDLFVADEAEAVKLWDEWSLSRLAILAQFIVATMLGLAAGMVLLLITGCVTVDHVKVEGWPNLRVVEHYVANTAMRDRCVKYTPAGASPIACAEFDFVKSRCDIWFSKDFPPSQSIVAHERLHCSGHDHAGSTYMADVWRTWKAAR